MQRIRWFAAGFALLQFFLYRPAPGASVPFPQETVGLLMAALVVAVNFGSMWLVRSHIRGPLLHLPLAGDTAVVMIIVWLFAFDPSSALWALLILPVLEGAFLLQMRGALWTWGASAVAYVAREAWASQHFGHPFLPDSVTYRLGIVLTVGLTAGAMARDLRLESHGHAEALDSSEERAEMLKVVADSGRNVGMGDPEELLSGVLDASLRLGFEVGAVCQYDEIAATWKVTHSRNLPATHTADARPIGGGLVGEVHRTGQRVVVRDYQTWDDALPEFRALGLGCVVASPIWAGGRLEAVLIVAAPVAGDAGSNQLEALELLAQQASAAVRSNHFIEMLRHQSQHDPLTGLPNQVLFEDRVNQALVRRERGGADLAVGLIDLDHFKRVNDGLGHAAGNDLLCQVAERIRDVLAAEDTVARLGGDEFTLLLNGRGENEDFRAAGERVVKALQQPFVVEGRPVFITASIGIAVCPQSGLTYQALLRNSDFAMYQSKQSGRSALTVFERDRPGEHLCRFKAEAELRRAIRDDELEVHYQPIVRMSDRRLKGVEALVRWRHPTRGLLGPAEFLPLASETGQMPVLDAFVLRASCAQAKLWSAVCAGPIPVAVNISKEFLMSPGFRETVLGAIRETGIDADLLELEMSEQIASSELSGGRLVLDELRLRGVRVSIDDFGTGWSALARLNDLEADRLKIDRSFVADSRSRDRVPVIAAALTLARELGLQAVAEGVEYEDQMGMLSDLGCELVQGYLLSPPVPAQAITDMCGRPLGQPDAA